MSALPSSTPSPSPPVLATQGMRPVAAIYSTFLQRAYDQIIHDGVAKAAGRVPPRSRRVRRRRWPHTPRHLRSHLPSLRARHDDHGAEGRERAAPHDEYRLHHRRRADRHPLSARRRSWRADGRADAPGWSDGRKRLREGADVAILAVGTMVLPAERAGDLLAAEGVNATVVNMRSSSRSMRKLVLEVARGVGDRDG